MKKLINKIKIGEKTISIKFLLFISSLCLAIIIVFFLAESQYHVLLPTLNQSEEYIEFNREKYLIDYLEDRINNMQNIIYLVQEDSYLIDEVKAHNNSENKLLKYQLEEKIIRRLVSLQQRIGSIQSISLITAKEHQFANEGYNIKNSYIEELQKQANGKDDKLLYSTVTENGESMLISDLVYQYANISIYDGDEYLGCIVLYLKNDFWTYFDNYYITDTDGKIIINNSHISDEADYKKIILSNGWVLNLKENIYYLSDTKKEIWRLSFLIFGNFILFTSFGIILFFRKPFKLSKNYYKAIDEYNKNSIEKQKPYNIRKKLVRYYTVSLVLPTILGIIIYLPFLNNRTEDILINKNSDAFFSAAEDISNTLNNKENVFLSWILNYDNQLSFFDEYEKENNYDKEYLQYDNLAFYENEITLYSSNNRLLYTNNDYDLEFIQKIDERYSIYTSKYNKQFLVVKKNFINIVDYKSNDNQTGILMIPLNEILDKFDYFESPSTKIYLSDENGYILNTNEDYNLMINTSKVKQTNGSILKKKDTGNIIYVAPLSNTTFHLAMEFDYKNISNENSNFIFLLSIIYILIIMFCISIIALITNIFTLPFIKFYIKVKEFEGFDDISIIDNKSRLTDAVNLTKQFNELIDKINVLQDKLIISANEKNQMLVKKHNAELTALYSQINPHYLTNTLENVVSLIDRNYPKKAIKMVHAINNQFRLAISRKSIKISFLEEIKYTKSYIEILNMRFDNNIIFEWDIDEKLNEYKVIKLILQPIIENAIMHAINVDQIKIIENYIVSITAKKTANTIEITICDNGIGIEKDKLEEIKQLLNNDDYYGNHVGLYNVHSRLQLYYGENYGLSIDSKVNVGTKIILCIKV